MRRWCRAPAPKSRGTSFGEGHGVYAKSAAKVHVFWRVTGFGPEQVEALQKQLARELGTDTAATPPTRLSGFLYLNHKYQPPHLVEIEYRLPGRKFSDADFPIPKPRMTRAATITRPPAPASGLGRWPDAMAQARRYLAHVPPAVASQHGDVQTFRVCCRLVRGFGLDNDSALFLLNDWNTRCEPPWPGSELRKKLEVARRYGREPMPNHRPERASAFVTIPVG